jgi:rhamnose utilization protein RhaD (predicted bifunctional aldolase and dehydrogenase)/NAD(P)-dependent dehydrogenase (short-subunit alcohol dehydrogenase family)
MKSLWSEREAAAFSTPLAQRVYSSRLLGRDRSLVLHGGGNTSVKLRTPNLLGDEEDLLYVKGSGWDLETIEEAGFTPVRLEYVARLAALEKLTDPQMVNELQTQRLHAASPAPSVETILHAILPHRYVDHTHADAVLAITNTRGGRQRIEELYGEDAVIIPYIMPGFDLAKLCARDFPRQRTAKTIGMILMNHGVFSFGETARDSYERMIALVDRAERYLKRHKAWSLPAHAPGPTKRALAADIAQLRKALSASAGWPLILTTSQSPRALRFSRDPNARLLAGQGPATPDHSIRTKRIAMVGRDVARYDAEYRRYFKTHASRSPTSKTMLDPAPRIVLDPELGLCAAGRSARDAAIALEIYEHTIDVALRASALGSYRALPARDVFDVEYWDLEQAKLKLSTALPEFSGEAAIVTGGAAGIGRACVDALLERGAAVTALDVNPAVTQHPARSAYLGLRCDVTDAGEVARAIEASVRRFGGLDMLVLNAGIFPRDAPIAASNALEWRAAMTLNVDANVQFLRACHPLLALAPNGGRVVIIGSKNVRAPGPGAAAYSASKAALTQIARVAALEWGSDRIRVNVTHPDGVFDTGLWSDRILQERAHRYGLSVEQYKSRNLLKSTVLSTDVARLVCAMCGAAFSRTTGAQVPIDGGNERVI